ncbi:MAG: 4-hydroxythreonine-4-phosphate dehydrogenase PdxA [Deltaproteobacteria bacterium]|nr:4-hydroxythreonine-4-phosphate dehydrogenase PdxA [Deltaproteobacteria bacterium]
MCHKNRPLLAVTMGDPGGIGPEICAKALSLEEIYRICRPLIIGDAAIMKNAADLCGLELHVHAMDNPEQGLYRHGTMDVIDLKNMPLIRLRHKQVSAEQGRASFEYIVKAIELAQNYCVDGTVTGPINKASINEAGFRYAGHTEIYAEKTGSKDYAMMLVDQGFRVIHVSTHVSMRQACDAVRKERVLRVIELSHEAVGDLIGHKPRLAVAALNPHCGENGLFGTEDDLEVAPAVHAARDKGINVEGPIPADTVFPKMKGGRYDAVVVMYHDQGHVPMKLLGFDYNEKTRIWSSMAGVNVTLGLPIIRTSVDHGTAFDKAGEGRANPQSMVEAIKVAVNLSLR